MVESQSNGLINGPTTNLKNCFSAGPSEEIQKNNTNEMIVELIPKIKLLFSAEISSKLDIFFDKRVKTQSEYPS